MKWNRKKRIEELPKLLKKKILILDGAMGTMIQAEKLSEADYRGERFKNHKKNLFGNNDILSLTKPDLISNIHLEFLKSGSSIIETNSFSSNFGSTTNLSSPTQGCSYFGSIQSAHNALEW